MLRALVYNTPTGSTGSGAKLYKVICPREYALVVLYTQHGVARCA